MLWRLSAARFGPHRALVVAAGLAIAAVLLAGAASTTREPQTPQKPSLGPQKGAAAGACEQDRDQGVDADPLDSFASSSSQTRPEAINRSIKVPTREPEDVDGVDYDTGGELNPNDASSVATSGRVVANLGAQNSNNKRNHPRRLAPDHRRARHGRRLGPQPKSWLPNDDQTLVSDVDEPQRHFRPTSQPDNELSDEHNEMHDSVAADELDLFLGDSWRSTEAARRLLGAHWAPASLEQSLEGSGGRLSRRQSSKASTKQRTIYFGGFFPSLNDDHDRETHLVAEPGDIKSRGEGESEADDDDATKLSSPKSNHVHQTGPEVETEPKATLLDTTKPSSRNASNTNLIPNWQDSVKRQQLGKFILPAVRLALDHINNNQSILPNYRLEIVPRDTQCNATISLKKFFDMVYEEPKKMLLYGDACRVSTDPIAKASYHFDLIQISYADTDPIYTIENYPNFFRVVPSENALSLARIPFIRHFNWTRVGTIYQNLPRYSLPHSKLLTDLERYNIVIKQSVSLPGSVDGLGDRDLGDELRKLKDKDVRIILGNFDEQWALLLFCEAFRENMIGRKYQWILTGISEDKLWRFYREKGSSCSEAELLLAMDGYIITDIAPVTRSQERTISGLMAHEYSNAYRLRAEQMDIEWEDNKFYGYVYDGIWAIALALNRVDFQLRHFRRLVETQNERVSLSSGSQIQGQQQQQQHPGSSGQQGLLQINAELAEIESLIDFDYNRPIWAKLIRNALNKTRFRGVTGTVSFDKNERPGLIMFSQFQAFRDTSEVVIASYDALTQKLDLNIGFPIFWRGSSPPIDYTIQRVTPFRINRTLFVIISVLAILGIVLAIVFLTINIKFRNQRYIKMSSPYLNNLIIIGCILTYTSVIILGLDSGLTSEYNFPYICNARAWVLMAGFTLAFGSMFSKTFRVHSIFTNIKLHKKVIKDYKLFMVVFILLTFDFCILIVWQYFDPFYRETNNGTSIQDLDNEDVIIVPEMEHCQSARMTVFLSIIYVYKGLLMAFGCFLAWETRHVSIPALNDSKYIGLSVYNVVIMCVIGASLSFVLRDQQDASFVIISIFIIFCSTTTLCLVFVPKVRMLYELKQNPKAGDQRVRATLKTFTKNYREGAMAMASSAGCRDINGNLIRGQSGMLHDNLNEKIRLLIEENLKNRQVLRDKSFELEALNYKYKKIISMIQSGQYLQALNTTAIRPSSILKSSTGSHGQQQALVGDQQHLDSKSPTSNFNISAPTPTTTTTRQATTTTKARTTTTATSTTGNAQSELTTDTYSSGTRMPVSSTTTTGYTGSSLKQSGQDISFRHQQSSSSARHLTQPSMSSSKRRGSRRRTSSKRQDNNTPNVYNKQRGSDMRASCYDFRPGKLADHQRAQLGQAKEADGPTQEGSSAKSRPLMSRTISMIEYLGSCDLASLLGSKAGTAKRSSRSKVKCSCADFNSPCCKGASRGGGRSRRLRGDHDEAGSSQLLTCSSSCCSFNSEYSTSSVSLETTTGSGSEQMSTATGSGTASRTGSSHSSSSLQTVEGPRSTSDGTGSSQSSQSPQSSASSHCEHRCARRSSSSSASSTKTTTGETETPIAAPTDAVSSNAGTGDQPTIGDDSKSKDSRRKDSRSISIKCDILETL